MIWDFIYGLFLADTFLWVLILPVIWLAFSTIGNLFGAELFSLKMILLATAKYLWPFLILGNRESARKEGFFPFIKWAVIGWLLLLGLMKIPAQVELVDARQVASMTFTYTSSVHSEYEGRDVTLTSTDTEAIARAINAVYEDEYDRTIRELLRTKENQVYTIEFFGEDGELLQTMYIVGNKGFGIKNGLFTFYFKPTEGNFYSNLLLFEDCFAEFQ